MRVMSAVYKVRQTHCLTAGLSQRKSTNVVIDLDSVQAPAERLVGLTALDLLGDRSDLAGKKLMITVEVIEEQES